MKRREFLGSPALGLGWGLAAAALPAWATAGGTVQDTRLLFLQGSDLEAGFGSALQGRPWGAAPKSSGAHPLPRARVAVHGHYLGKSSRIDAFSMQAVYAGGTAPVTHDLYTGARRQGTLTKPVGFHAEAGTFGGLSVQRSLKSAGLACRPTTACLAPNSLTGSMQKGCYVLLLDPDTAGFLADELFYSGDRAQPLQDASGRRVLLDHVLLSVEGTV